MTSTENAGLPAAAVTWAHGPALVTVAAIALVTLMTLVRVAGYHEERELVRLQAIAAIKAEHISTWLRDRMASVKLLRKNELLADQYRQWTVESSPKAWNQLIARLNDYLHEGVFRQITLLDGSGGIIWQAADRPALDPESRARIVDHARAMAADMMSSYRDTGGHLHVDFLAPLPSRDGSAAPLIVLHADPGEALSSSLQEWPGPASSGEVLLVRRNGEYVQYLNELRHRDALPADKQIPVTDHRLLATQVLHGGRTDSSPLDGLDYRGEPVIGSTRPVAGTDWFVIAKMDRAEIRSIMLRDAIWIVLAGLLAIIATMIASRLLNQRRELAWTRREQAALLAAQEQLRKLSLAVEQNSTAVLITDTGGCIEYVNTAFAQITGYDRDEVLGRRPGFLNSGRTPAATYRAMNRALKDGHPWKGEFINRRRDGREYVVQASITPLRRADGTISHYVAVEEDITELKRANEELEQHRCHLEELVADRTSKLEAAKRLAESANVAKGSFLANMSHEIRTPMNAIIGFTHLLRRRISTPEHLTWLDKIDAAGQHLLAVINDILDMAKIEAGKLQLADETFLLGAIPGQVAALIQPSAGAKGLYVAVECNAPSRMLRGDPTRLRQALLNYASNAVKFTDSGTVRLRVTATDSVDGSVLLRCEVEDTGIGIPAEVAMRLFSAFQQADSSNTRKHGGTGLGLAVTRQLARLMGGDAGVDSSPGQGSTFWFTARLQAGGTEETPFATGDAASRLRTCHANARLLVVEDNCINMEVALELLSDVGLAADTARNGIEAVALAGTAHYDLILMDVQMPEMDGLDATRAIRAIDGLGTTPIVAMTANAFEADRQECLAAGMNDFVAKPVQPEALYGTLLRWLPTTTG